ncbi:MAG TPA: cytochrome c-type biogenesis CcmF C-terminal domain-containing protein [Fimbriimonadaceae bacterium]|nr:cytochrome c-type biogenesis CcmF C-terminal domain-containing protein [Fimbriimonadaceae bacterium]
MLELDPTQLVTPPEWSLTIGLLGRLLVLIAAGAFALSGVSWFASKRWPGGARLGRHSFNLACWSLIGSFLTLAVLFVANRFEFEYVFGHADSKNALGYRIAGIWSGQEGSFLLWGVCAAVFGLITVGKLGLYRRWYTIAFSFFLGGIASILAFESPFNLNLFEGKPFVPAEGLGLAPSLQNYWVIIHPPTIFLGFGSLTVLFALAFAALVEKDFETWVPIVRPLAIVSVTLVGLGLCMGGFWAYETLGWGGFWMWDPVENVSFVPWCFTAAFIHGLLVQVTKKKWQITNLLLAGLPFLIFLYGTFLTRSGFLSEASVHSFAEMDRSALKLLITLMGGATAAFAILWAVRAFQHKRAAVAEPTTGVRREAFYIMGITALMTMGIATTIGMSVPLLQAMQGQKAKVVEESVYHQVLPWIFVPLMVLMGIAPFVAWNGSKVKDLLGRLYTTLCITVGLTGLFLFLAVVTPFSKQLDMAPKMLMLNRFEVSGFAWILTLFGLCVFVLVANAWRIRDLVKRSKLGVSPFLAHVGVAILMVGLIVSRGFEKKAQSIVMEDHPGRVLNYEVRYAGMTSSERDRDNKLKLEFYDPHKKGSPLFVAEPGLYKLTMANGEESTMVWPHIERGWLMDTYVAIGQPQTDASQDVTLTVGKATQFGGLTIRYKEMTRTGEFGMSGTRFGALVEVSGGGRTETVNPQMEIAEAGKMVMHPAKIDDQLQLAMVSMNAADKSVTLRVQLTSPMYPVEVYHKPLTGLVWFGTGLMTLSGFAAAFYRRSRRRVPVVIEEAPVPTRKAKDLVAAIEGKRT